MDAADAKSNAKVSKVSLPQLKLMAKHLNISTSQKKEALVDAIRDKVARRKLLGTALTEKEGSFRKDQNTFPRLCNILMQFFDALERSKTIVEGATAVSNAM